MQNNRTYTLSPYVRVLRDREPLSLKYKASSEEDKYLVLEKYQNDVYHHFLHALTETMQSSELKDEQKLRSLFEEMLKTKKLLEESR